MARLGAALSQEILSKECCLSSKGLIAGPVPLILCGRVAGERFRKRRETMSKRVHARVMVHRRVGYTHAEGQGEGMLLDLSLHGCRIKGVPPGSCGTRLRLQLWLPDQSEPVKIELATVRWVKHEQFSVSFLEVSPDTQARLKQVFQLLHEAQQPEARMIQMPASAFSDAQHGAPNRGPRRGAWEPMD
jgi:hypothetical protein